MAGYWDQRSGTHWGYVGKALNCTTINEQLQQKIYVRPPLLMFVTIAHPYTLSMFVCIHGMREYMALSGREDTRMFQFGKCS